MSKILVTGAGGYIGSVATDLFLKSGYQVVGVDNFQTGYKAPLELLKSKYPNQFKFYEVDLTKDLSPIFKEETDISAVVHYAASCLVDESMKDPGKYFLNNVAVTSNLLSAMDKFNIKNIRPLCTNCNTTMGNKHMAIFMFENGFIMDENFLYGKTIILIDDIVT
ncbi:MAG: NAD-dependent epimerase/dehydratase family protein, partial [Patescibacteria group bacterium]